MNNEIVASRSIILILLRYIKLEKFFIKYYINDISNMKYNKYMLIGFVTKEKKYILTVM